MDGKEGAKGRVRKRKGVEVKGKGREGKEREQHAQLMLTNLHDAFIGQSRSSNIVSFLIVGIIIIIISFLQKVQTLKNN